MGENKSILQISKIDKSFGETHALKQVDLEIFDNEVHAIVGSNGAGKSTMMKILAGIYKPDSGTITYMGEDITGLSPKELQAKGIQVVHQVLNIVGSMTVLENILLAMPPVKNGMLNWEAGRKQVEETMELIDFPLDLNVTADSLSVSEQQFIILARALVNQTKILILDEPTARLGLEETNKLFHTIDRLKKKGVTVIYISHRMEEIYTICDRISVFRDGKCIRTEYTRDFGKDALVSAMLGKKMEAFYPKEKTQIGEELLRVEELSYGTRLNHVSLHVRRGEIVSVVGPVGAGKTELVDIIFGILKKSEGTVKVGENEITDRHSPGRAIRMGIALIPEDRGSEGMFGEYNIKNNISSVDMEYVCKKGVLKRRKENALAEGMVEKLKIHPADINYLTSDLSGGNQQKVVIGKWLTHPYQLYLMDEVTSGVDIGAKAEIYKLMGTIAKEGGAILLATGDIEEAMGISDRIIVLFKGKVVYETTPERTSKDTLLKYIMGGTANE